MERNEVVIAYIPVLHSGYIKFLEGHSTASVYLIPGEMSELKFFNKDIRAIPPEQMATALAALRSNPFVGVLTSQMIEIISREDDVLYMPDEEISHEIYERHFKGHKVIFEDVFLRWHRRKLEEQVEVEPDFTMPMEGFLKDVLQVGLHEASKSPDWWLQVGAVIWKDKKILLKGFNTHVPTPRITEVFGDPRAFSSRGKNIELTTALHAEAGLISTAAKFGIPLRGNSIFVTVFPCPPCAKLIANSGLKWLYYLDGYSVLEGANYLKQEEVRIIKVLRD